MIAFENFSEAMRRAGLEYAGLILADGKLHRLSGQSVIWLEDSP